MHEPLLAEAALPASTRVAGIELKPYSLGHELFLIREKSPFLFAGEIAEEDLPAAIFEAVLICSSSFEWSKTARHTYLYWPILWMLKRRVAKHLAKCNLREAEAAFREYRENGCREFPISDNIRPERQQSSGRDPGTPFILRLQQFLMLRFRLSESEAWDYPVGLAKMRWAAFWEQEGGLDVKNWFDAECDRLAAEDEQKEETCPA